MPNFVNIYCQIKVDCWPFMYVPNCASTIKLFRVYKLPALPFWLFFENKNLFEIKC